MCRLLFVRSADAFSIAEQLRPFAQLSRQSREFQGHGWGCSWLPLEESPTNKWQHYRCIDPIWEDDLNQFAQTRLLLVHARSAFRDEGIVIENNMPFSDGDTVFIFNGELRGVKINSEGRIGAEKIYNYIRAMNIILSDGNSSVVSSTYNEDPDYFQMYRDQRNGLDRLCSEPFPGETGWLPISNNSVAFF